MDGTTLVRDAGFALSVVVALSFGLLVGIVALARVLRDTRRHDPEETEPRELLCMECGLDYPIWYAPSELWNRVVREPDGSDRWPFLCPGCFTRIAAMQGGHGIFVVSEEPR